VYKVPELNPILDYYPPMGDNESYDFLRIPYIRFIEKNDFDDKIDLLPRFKPANLTEYKSS
jgi:hypothetical protein